MTTMNICLQDLVLSGVANGMRFELPLPFPNITLNIYGQEPIVIVPEPIVQEPVIEEQVPIQEEAVPMQEEAIEEPTESLPMDIDVVDAVSRLLGTDKMTCSQCKKTVPIDRFEKGIKKAVIANKGIVNADLKIRKGCDQCIEKQHEKYLKKSKSKTYCEVCGMSVVCMRIHSLSKKHNKNVEMIVVE